VSRFGDPSDYEEYYPNQGDLWWSNIKRALNGKRGQRALRDLEEALVALPEKRLVRGHIATLDGSVCAVGALILHKRVTAGEAREAVLAEFARPEKCWCGHERSAHTADGAPCSGTWPRWPSTTLEQRPCSCEHYEADTEDDGGDATASAGTKVGLTYSLAWRLAYLNDEDYGEATDEERYEKVLAWVREAQMPGVVAA